jgi:hypothetical protein
MMKIYFIVAFEKVMLVIVGMKDKQKSEVTI